MREILYDHVLRSAGGLEDPVKSKFRLLWNIMKSDVDVIHCQ